MVNETENVVLTSPTPGLWTGRRGIAACTVEQLTAQYKITVVSIERDCLLAKKFCATVECVRSVVRNYGFDFQPEPEYHSL